MPMRVVLVPGAIERLDVTGPLLSVARMVVEDAKRVVPVRTGRLRDSIRVGSFTSRESVRVDATAPYAGYVELGTRYMDAQPYLRPSLYKWRGRLG